LANRYFERRAIPPSEFYVPTNQRVDARTGEAVIPIKQAAQYVEEIHHGHTMVLPHEIDNVTKDQKWRWNIKETDQRGDMFIEYLSYLDALMLRGLGFPEKAILQGSSVGSFAETSEMVDTFMVVVDAILRQIKEHLDNWVIPQIVRYNFGLNAEPPGIMFDRFTKMDRELWGRIIKSVVEEKRVNEAGRQYSMAELIDAHDLSRKLGSALGDPEKLNDPKVDDALIERGMRVLDKNRPGVPARPQGGNGNGQTPR
jgi:hypothetical protein